MKPKTMILMVVAIVCGLGASYMTSRLLAERNLGEAEVAKVSVLVAKKNLDLGTPLKNPKDQFEEKLFIKGEEPKNAVINSDQFKDKFLKRSLRKGDFVTPEDMVDQSGALSMPDGMRAVGFRVNSETVAAGFASLPGSRVDILHTLRRGSDDDSKTSILLEDVLVLAADQKSDRPEGGALPANVVTVALTPEDAMKVTLAKEVGSLHLILRKPGEKNKSEVTSVSITQILRSRGGRDSKSGDEGGAFEGAAGSDDLKLPTIARSPKNKKDDTKVETTPEPTPPAPLAAQPPAVRKHVVTVVEGEQSRKVVYLLNENGEVSQEDVVGSEQPQPAGPRQPAQPPALGRPSTPAAPTPAAPQEPKQGTPRAG